MALRNWIIPNYQTLHCSKLLHSIWGRFAEKLFYNKLNLQLNGIRIHNDRNRPTREDETTLSRSSLYNRWRDCLAMAGLAVSEHDLNKYLKDNFFTVSRTLKPQARPMSLPWLSLGLLE